MTTSLHYYDESAERDAKNSKTDAKSDGKRSECDINTIYAIIIIIVYYAEAAKHKNITTQEDSKK